MDDFHYIIPLDCDYRNILSTLYLQAARNKFTLNSDKTRYVSITKPFRYCKTKYIVTESGRVVTRANKTAVPRDRRKIKALYKKVMAGEMTWEDVWTSINGMLAYLEGYDEHNNVLKLRRLFYSIFGFSCESIENFRRRECDEIHHSEKI